MASLVAIAAATASAAATAQDASPPVGAPASRASADSPTLTPPEAQQPQSGSATGLDSPQPPELSSINPPARDARPIRLALVSASIEQLTRVVADALGKRVDFEAELVEAPTQRDSTALDETIAIQTRVAVDWCEPAEIPPRELLLRASELLGALGFSLVESGDALTLQRTLPHDGARDHAAVVVDPTAGQPTTLLAGTAPDGGRADALETAATRVARVIPLASNWSRADVASLRVCITPSAAIALLPQSGALLIVASPEEADRVERLLQSIDRLGAEGELTVRALRHVDAERAMLAVDALLRDLPGTERTWCTADPVLRAIVVRGTASARALATRAIELIDALPDAAAAPPTPDSMTAPQRAERVEGATARNDGDIPPGAIVISRLAASHPQSRIALIRELAPTRLRNAVRLIEAPDATALLLSGRFHDVELVRAMATSIDLTDRGFVDTALITFAALDAREALELSRVLEEIRTRPIPDARSINPLRFELDPSMGQLLVVGAPNDVQDARRAVRASASRGGIERERGLVAVPRTTIEHDFGWMSAVADTRAGAIGAVAEADQPSSQLFVDLGVAVIDAPAGGLVRAQAAQRLMNPTARSTAGEPLLSRTIRVPPSRAAEIAEQARLALASEIASDPQLPTNEPLRASIVVDQSTGALQITGEKSAVDALGLRINALRGVAPLRHDARIVLMRTVAIEDAVEALTRLAEQPIPLPPTHALSDIAIRELPERGAVLFAGEPAYVALFAELANTLDAASLAATESMRTLGLRCRNPDTVEARLREQFDTRAPENRVARPFYVAADVAHGTIAIAFHDALLPELIDILDAAEPVAEGRGIRPREVFSTSVSNSDAKTVAAALNMLFASSSAPVDGFGRELLHLRESRSTVACGDRDGRRVWIESWRDLSFDPQSLVSLLDRLAIGPSTELALFRSDRGDLEAAARTLRDLAARGLLGDEPTGDADAARVAIDLDPATRTIVVVGRRETQARASVVLRQLGVKTSERVTCILDALDADVETLRQQAIQRTGADASRPAEPAVFSASDAVRGTVAFVGEPAEVAQLVRDVRARIEPAERAQSAARVPLRSQLAREFGALLRELPVGVGGLAAVHAPVSVAVEQADVVGREIMLVGTPRAVALLTGIAEVLSDASAMPPLRAVFRPIVDADVATYALRAWFAARSETDRRERPVWIDVAPCGKGVLLVAHEAEVARCEELLIDIQRAHTFEYSTPQSNHVGVHADDAREWRVAPVAIESAHSIAAMLHGGGANVIGAGDANALLIEAAPDDASLLAACVAQFAVRDRVEDVTGVVCAVDPDVASAARAIVDEVAQLPNPASAAEPRARVSIEASANGLLTMCGSADDVVKLGSALQVTSTPFRARTALRVITLRNADPDALTQVLRAALAHEIGESGAQRSRDLPHSARLTVGVDSHTRAILLRGSPERVALAAEVARMLDDELRGTRDDRVRLVPTTHISPRAAIELLETREAVTAARAVDFASAIVLRGGSTEIARAAALLRDVDRAEQDAAVVTHVHRLRSSEGAQAASLLVALLTEQRSAEIAAGRAREADDQPTVGLEARDRTLTIRGSQRAIEFATEALDAIELTQGWTGQVVSVFVPTTLSLPETLHALGGRTVDRWDVGPTVVPLWRSASLLVVGGAEDVKRTRDLLTALDRASASDTSIECALYTLTHADTSVAAATVVAGVGGHFRVPPMQGVDARPTYHTLHSSAVPAIDARSVLVCAPPPQMDIAERLLALLDAQHEAGSRRDVRVYPIAQVDVRQAARAVRQGLDARAQPGLGVPVALVEAIAGSALIAVGEPAWLEAVDAIMRTVDVRALREAVRMRVVSVRRRDSAYVARILAQLLSVEETRVAADRQVSREFSAAQILVDRGRSAILIIGSPMTLDLAEEIVLDLDHEPGVRAARTFRLYEFAEGEAELVAKSIENRFEMDERDEAPPTVRRQTARNGVLVRSTDAQRTVIESMLTRAVAGPSAPTSASTSRMMGVAELGLGVSETETVARALERATQRGTVDRAERVPLAITVDRPTATLACFGEPEAVAQTLDLARQMAELSLSIPLATARFAVPASADPRIVASLVRAMSDRLRDDAALRMHRDMTRFPIAAIGADAMNRAVVVTAAPGETVIVEEMVNAIVRSQGLETVAIRVLALERANGSRIVEVLREKTPRAEGVLSVAPMTDSAGIVVCGTPSAVERAAQLAARFDRMIDAQDQEVRVVPLRSISTADAASLLTTAATNLVRMSSIDPTTIGAIVLSGPVHVLDAQGALLSAIDEPSPRLPATVVAIPVAPRVPSDVAAAFRARHSGEQTEQHSRIRVIPCDQAGVLFVRGESDALAELRAMLALPEP
jgi:type II secretory pathway component GspD/PulD (secretin)